MNCLPRLLADYLCLWRDVVRFPRQVLLNRSHSIASMATIGGTCLVDLAIGHPCTEAVVYAALVVFGPPASIAFAGSIAHTLWGRGLIWADLDCELCGGGPDDDDGYDDDLGPDDPDDPHGLIRDITAYLRTHSAVTCTH
ncbi:hypothetical protein [Streptomyces niveus]|uniref:hypothetical protein n=1 Tax=Streptomyces niveus TaxID=193462 RepID=UPI0036D25C42